MYRMTTLTCLCVLMLGAEPALAEKGYCQDGSKRICKWIPGSASSGQAGYYDDNGQYMVKSCHCKSAEGSGDLSGTSPGHGEVHKRNVPTVQKNPGPGPKLLIGARPHPQFRSGAAPVRAPMLRRW